MRSVNKVLLMGHLAADPEIKMTPNGHHLARFKVATSRDWKNNNGEKVETTDYHKIVAWEKLGEICGEYLKKGSAVYLEGRITNHSFEDKQGIKRHTTEIIADTINFISSKKTNGKEIIDLHEIPG